MAFVGTVGLSISQTRCLTTRKFNLLPNSSKKNLKTSVSFFNKSFLFFSQTLFNFNMLI